MLGQRYDGQMQRNKIILAAFNEPVYCYNLFWIPKTLLDENKMRLTRQKER